MFQFWLVYTEVLGEQPVVALLKVLFIVIKRFWLTRTSLNDDEKISRSFIPEAPGRVYVCVTIKKTSVPHPHHTLCVKKASTK